MPITLGAFLSQFGKIRDIEMISKEQFEIISNSKIDSPKYALKLGEWLFNELTLLNGYKKIHIKLKEEIKTNYFISAETLPFEDLETMGSWLIYIGFENEWEIIEDKLLCKLQNDFLNFYNVRLNHFYSEKINQLKINSAEIRKILFPKIQLIENEEDKLIFNDFFEYLNEFHSHHVIEKDVKKNDWHPFHNDDVRDFYFYLESKYDTTETKSIFSAFWKFFENEGLIDIKDKRIKQRYITWLNERFNFQDVQVIKKLQTNTASFDLADFEKHYLEFEASKGDDFRFYDFREEGISRTKKKPSSK